MERVNMYTVSCKEIVKRPHDDHMYSHYHHYNPKYNVNFEFDNYVSSEDVSEVRTHKIFRFYERTPLKEGEFPDLVPYKEKETLFTVEPKLAEMLLQINYEDLYNEAKQGYYEDLKCEIRNCKRLLRDSKEQAHYFEKFLLDLEKRSFLERVKWVFKGLPEVDLFGYIKRGEK